MTIYHGGFNSVSKPKIIKGKYTKDFGDGFYCTKLKPQAERWCLKYNTPTISTYEYDENAKENLEIISFDTMTEEWLDFVIASRTGKPHKYDIIIGAMADDQIYNYISDLIESIISREAFWALAKFKYPTHQIAFCTEKALKQLIFVKSERVIS